MPIYKRGKKYWVDVSSPTGERIRRSTGTSDKTKAQEYHDKLKHDLWQQERLGKQVDRIFEDIIVLVLRDSQGQASYKIKQTYAKYFITIFGGRKLSSITNEDIANSLPDYSPITKCKLTNATKNRYRSFIMRAFSLAYKMGWVKSQNFTPRMREPIIRVRWLELEQAQELINNLNLEWMKQLVSLALLTGMRKGELLSLTWKNVDLDRKLAYVTADNAKSKKARPVPLNDEAVLLLRSIPKLYDLVFTNNGNRKIVYSREDFSRAIKRTGLTDFTFHDLRHTWASWHVQRGTPLMALKEMGGWETLEMVKKYAHLSGEHLSKYSEQVTILTQAQNERSENIKLRLITA